MFQKQDAISNQKTARTLLRGGGSNIVGEPLQILSLPGFLSELDTPRAGEILEKHYLIRAFDYLEPPNRRLAGLEMLIPYNHNLEYHSVPQVESIPTEARKLARGEY